MIIVKITILLVLVTVFLLGAFKLWIASHPIQAIAEDYPAWTYIMAYLILLDVIGIFASAIWFLFFYL